MIIKEQEQELEDAPPAYEAGSSGQTFADTKVPYPSPSPSSSSSRSPAPSPTSPSSSSLSSKGKGKSAASSSWWSFGMSQTTREVRATVLGIVRDLVKLKSGSTAAAQSILESCAEACSGYDISLSSLLQEKSIEGHTPLFWAIVNRPPEKNGEISTGIVDLLTILLNYTAPLTPSILIEVRQACLIADDQLLFQRFRLSPEFASLDPASEMIFGQAMIPDDVTVETKGNQDQGEFAVNFRIPYFQRRMKVTQKVTLEFIARGRLWNLSLCVADRHISRHGGSHTRHGGPSQGSWCIVLSMMENSAPTWIDSQLIISEALSNKKNIHSRMDSPEGESAPAPAPSSPGMLSGILGDRLANTATKPPITFRLQPYSELCSSDGHHSHHFQSRIVVPLDGVPLGSSLQHAGSSYIGADESLSGRLEARLTKPQGDTECIIC